MLDVRFRAFLGLGVGVEEVVVLRGVSLGMEWLWLEYDGRSVGEAVWECDIERGCRVGLFH